jgi:hypothetical protein
MNRIPADEIVAVYLAQASAAADRLLPAQREHFLDRLHDEVRERVGPRPRRDVEAVSAALAELGEPADLVERERLSRWSEAKIRDGRRLYQARPWPGPAERAALLGPGGSRADVMPGSYPVPDAGSDSDRHPGSDGDPRLREDLDLRGDLDADLLGDFDPDSDLDSDLDLGDVLAPGAPRNGLDAAVGRQRDWDAPTEVYGHPLFRDTPPEPIEDGEALPRPSLRASLRTLRWELGALAMFVVGPQLIGLLALLIGAAMVARSAYWDVRDKVRALLGIPSAGALFVLVRAWAESTQLNELESSSTRLRAAGESLLDSIGVAVPVLGLLIAAWLGWLVARDGRRHETAGRARRSGR